MGGWVGWGGVGWGVGAGGVGGGGGGGGGWGGGGGIAVFYVLWGSKDYLFQSLINMEHRNGRNIHGYSDMMQVLVTLCDIYANLSLTIQIILYVELVSAARCWEICVIFSCDQAALRMVQSVRLSVRPSHLFDYVPIIISSRNFQELLPMTEVMSMQTVKVIGQRSRSQRSWPNIRFRTVTPVRIYIWWWNDA